MKGCCFKYFLLLFFVFLQLLASEFAVVVEPQINQLPGQLLADGKVITTQSGKDIELTKGSGLVNLTLSSGRLEVEVCKDKCKSETSQICYEAEYQVSGAVGSCGAKYCGFKIEGGKETLNYAGYPFPREFIVDCLSSSMEEGHATIVPNNEKFKSCKPNLDNGNMVKLWVDIDQDCPIVIKNAALYIPPTTSTSLPLSSLATASPSKKDETSEASLPWWAYLIIAFVVLLALIAVGAVVILVYRDHQKAKQKALRPPPENPIPEIAVVPTVHVQTPVEKPVEEPVKEAAAKENVAQPAPPQADDKPKKSAKKGKTVEPTTTEDAPAEPTKEDPPLKAVKQNDDQEKKTVEPTEDDPTIPTKDEAAPVPVIQGFRNPSPTRTVPQSLKSVKTDSLQFVTKKEIIELAESVSVSLEHHSLKPIGVDLIAGMKSNYPEMVHDVRKDEIDLFCTRVGKMYALICALSVTAEQTLVSVGCIFDEFHRILSFTPDGRRYLNEKHTAATTVYFAFGAEYHEFVVDAPELIQKASVPLLMVIALQSRFPELVRRQACARLRRKLPLLLCNYKAADREKMPFPINVIEPAYGRAPIMFRDLKAIQSDSSGERKKKKQLQDKENQVKPGGETKAKKKSSKKRH